MLLNLAELNLAMVKDMNICFDTYNCAECKDFCSFSVLNENEKKLLKENTTNIRYNKNETIFKQKTYVSNVLYIKDGLVKLCIEGSNGKNLIIKILRAGDFIGLTDLYNKGLHTFTAIALINSSVFSFEVETFKKIISSNIEFSKNIMTWYCQMSEYIFNKLSTLGTKQMHGRLADIILYLSSEEFAKTGVFGFLSRNDIAELTGMSKENAIRLLTEFRNDGLIRMNGKNIEINNIQLLQKLSSIG